jgi:prophage regulatory protein
MEEHQPAQRFLRRRAVQAISGLSTSGLYQAMRDGTFPRPVPIGRRARAWIETEIREWQETLIRERDSENCSKTTEAP